MYLAAFINFLKCKQVSVVDGLDMVRKWTLRSGTRRTDTLVALGIGLRLLCLRSGYVGKQAAGGTAAAARFTRGFCAGADASSSES